MFPKMSLFVTLSCTVFVPWTIQPARAQDAVGTTAVAPAGVDWVGLTFNSLEFLGLEHGFRYLTESQTRHPHISFFSGYVESLNNLHGWADGDPFFVNYIGHPLQGAASGFIFVQNDRSFRTAEFGRNRHYWKSRLRAAAFAWAYSEQFEVGPLSEASVGHIQARYPQQGFVDQVVTPAIGLGWMIGEDAADRYLIKRLEEHTRNKYLRATARGVLNPSRTLANLMANRVPWHRETRLDPGEIYRAGLPLETSHAEHRDYPLAAPFELFATTRISVPFGEKARGACIGGGAAAAFRIATHWELAGDVRGCNLTAFGRNLSGDSLTYLIGPRWTPRPESRWQPFTQLLVGGRTLTHEKVDPLKKAEAEAAAAKEGKSLGFEDHGLYTQITEHTGFAVSAGAGFDWVIRSAISLRVGQVDYMHSWHSRLSGVSYANTAQFSTGLVLRFGTW
jgi:hypothetical protein